MKKVTFAAGLIAGAALLSYGDGLAQTPASPARIAVNEAKARAVLQGDAIQVQLPLNVPAESSEHAVAWLLSPIGTSSSETAVDLPVGSRSVGLTLSWPKDSHGNHVEEIGWYRVGYRIELAGKTQTSGIVAVGAIASNLLDLRVASPERLDAGMPLSVRIYAGNPITREPFRGVHLEAKLAMDLETTGKAKPATRTIVREATSGRSGEAILTFPLPAGPGQTGTLTVKGSLIGAGGPGSKQARATASIETSIETSDKTVIRIETDKPLHKPGEVVHMRALVFDDAGHAAANAALTLTTQDAENKKLLEVSLTTNRFGIASYDWKTSPQLAPGDYDATFEIDGSSDYDGSASTPIRIQRYELPEFAVSAATDRGFYLEGETPTVRIHAGYLFGKPVAAGTVRIVRASEGAWDRKTGKPKEPASAEQSAVLNAKGDVELHLDVKGDFYDFKDRDYQRYSDLEYRAIVTDDSTGRSEPRSFAVRLSREPVHIYLDEMGGSGREGDYILTTSYADGSPAPCNVTLDWMDGDSHATRAAAVATNRYGLARVHLRYAESKQAQNGLNLRLIALDPEGRSSKLDDTINPSARGEIWIGVAHTLLKPGQPIEALVHGTVGSAIDVDVLAETGLVAHYRVRMNHAAEPLAVAAGPASLGLVTLRAYVMNGDLPQYRWGWEEAVYKAVLYPQDRELKVRLTGLRPSYTPGASVDARFDVHLAGGAVALSALGVSVIDSAVEQRAATEVEANEHWFGWNWWQEGGNVAGITREALDRIDTSEPISDDLDLAAEKLFSSTPGARVQIEAKYDDAVRNDYESAMKRDLKPIGQAMLSARPAHLPGSIDAVHTIALAAKLDDALLLDPWNTPYKARTELGYDDEVLNLVSAGPDKRFGTADDFTVEVARRNLFALPGERLTKILQDAAAAERPLPGTLDALKELTRNGGLDLDAILDPQGKPYDYAILVRRRFYSIQVLAQAGNAIWTSPSIDYFSRTEARLEASIRRIDVGPQPLYCRGTQKDAGERGHRQGRAERTSRPSRQGNIARNHMGGHFDCCGSRSVCKRLEAAIDE